LFPSGDNDPGIRLTVLNARNYLDDLSDNGDATDAGSRHDLSSAKHG
jgi:hypothetical protein